jgi:long-chain fatty acid transport protein
MKRLVLCISAVLSLVATQAKASPLFELSGDTLGTGGFQGRTRASGSAATYFNPSLLTEAEQGFELSEFVIYDHIRTILDGRPSSVDIPELAADSFGGAQPSLPTPWLQNGCEPATSTCSTEVPARPRGGNTSSGEFRAYQGIGLVNHLWPDVLSLGFYALVPIGPFTTGHSFFVDEREQYFTNSLHPELFSDRLTAISLAFGVGVRVFKQLSLGVSATLALRNEADADTFTGDPDDVHNSIELSTKLKVLNSISPHGGLTYTPLDWLRIAATVHSPQKTEIVTRFANILPTGDYQWAERTAVLSYMPWIVGLGGEARVLKVADTHALGVSGLVTYERWSKYRNRQDQHPHGRYEWSDTLVYVLGTRHTYRERLTSFIDLSYRPSPVPAQTGRTNYVDNDRWSGDVGVQWLIPLQRQRVALRFGAQAQLHYLVERHQKKDDPRGKGSQLVRDEWADDTIDRTTNPAVPFPEARGLQTNNPGYPGYGSDGWVMGGGINMAVLF